jgi:hypothetical protein
MDAATTTRVLALVAGGLASAAAVVRAVRDDLTGALTAAGLALVAFAAAIGNL